MMCLDPFQRAAILTLAWCLIGLGIDTESPAHPTANPPAVNAERSSASDLHKVKTERMAEKEFRQDQTSEP